jgi:hypothetical protein
VKSWAWPRAPDVAAFFQWEAGWPVWPRAAGLVWVGLAWAELAAGLRFSLARDAQLVEMVEPGAREAPVARPQRREQESPERSVCLAGWAWSLQEWPGAHD